MIFLTSSKTNCTLCTSIRFKIFILLDSGERKMVDCQLDKDNRTNLIWKMDGQIVHLQDEKIHFDTDSSKYVAVTCEYNCSSSDVLSDPCQDSEATQVISQTFLICALDETQKYFIIGSAIIIVIWILPFTVYLRKKSVKWVDDHEDLSGRTKVRNKKFNKIKCLKMHILTIFHAVRGPIWTSAQFIFDVVTDWVFVVKHAYTGHYVWATTTFCFIQASTFTNLYIGMQVMFKYSSVYPRLFDSIKKKMIYTFMFFINMGPVLFRLDEVLDRFQQLGEKLSEVHIHNRFFVT